MAWDFEELKVLVENKHGAGQSNLLDPLLNSLWRKLEIARYHSIESRRLTEQYFGDDSFENYNKAFRYIFDRINGDEEARKFFQDAFIAEANIVAYSQSMHSAFDILGKVIIESLKIDHMFHANQNIYLFTVKNKLKHHGIANNIVTEIETAINNDSYKYLRAFVNVNKHLCLLRIPHTVEMNAASEIPFGMKIEPFLYENEHFQEKWARYFVTEEFNEISESIVKIGNSINDHLKI
ncbi:hypothetical protein OR1_02724 [Geobacter sp. OR-1]|uniref:hypothetical protein n=1 Tax=Geobacter sp. OR-1 TaxID=1266765 RepID=UPI000543288D|nr:hypothetical protein [Geobacter sp. OR-1]GAM10435.1 hypothetical protein OR1_02724 [Geobacter sp. OR-1]